MKPSFPLSLALALLAPLCLAAPTTPPKKAAPKPATKPKPKPKATPKPKPKSAPRPAVRPAPRPAQPQPIPAPEPVATGPKTWALLVGVSEYQNTQISTLRFPAKDAAGLRDTLLDPNLGGLARNQVLLLADEDATRDKIMGAVDSFLRPNVKEGDKVIVFLAGHGVAKGAGASAKSYFLPTDVKGLTTAAFETSAVPLRVLTESIGTLPASQFVILVDACREDPTPGRGGLKANPMTDVMSRSIAVVPQNKNAEWATFFACDVGQRAFEDEKLGHGVFTNSILEAIKQGAVPKKPDGAVEMGTLGSYVVAKVGEWAKAISASGDNEVNQTPQLQLISTKDVVQPLVLFKVKRTYSDTPFATSAGRLFVAASPEGAQVSINGTRAGVGYAEKALAGDGDYTIQVTAPGYAPVSRSVKALGGYEQQLLVQLQPLAGAQGAGATVSEAATEFYRRALDAQERDQWEIAEQGFIAAIGASPKFTAAHEALIESLYFQNRNHDAVGASLNLLKNAPRDQHSLSLLSRAYSLYAEKSTTQTTPTSPLPTVARFNAPKNPADAVRQARLAATEALALGASAPEANLAQGYALAALDTGGKNKQAAIAAFAKAAFLDASDAANSLGYGYGVRVYAMQLKNETQKRAELTRAISILQEATKLRPNYYEAHRELAFCYIALGDTPNALRECRLARSNRGGAPDINEIAGIEVAMSGLHTQAAQNSTGDKKAANEAASKGYLDEAKETSKGNLKFAFSILNGAGISTSLSSYLPAELRPLLDIRGTIQGRINDALPTLPGGGRIRIPGF